MQPPSVMLHRVLVQVFQDHIAYLAVVPLNNHHGELECDEYIRIFFDKNIYPILIL